MVRETTSTKLSSLCRKTTRQRNLNSGSFYCELRPFICVRVLRCVLSLSCQVGRPEPEGWWRWSSSSVWGDHVGPLDLSKDTMVRCGWWSCVRVCVVCGRVCSTSKTSNKMRRKEDEDRCAK